MLDSKSFREINPQFPSQKHDALQPKTTITWDFDICSSTDKSAKVKYAGLDPKNMKESDLEICSHLVYGFILNDKLWGEWNPWLWYVQ